jgi:hypothetical protein
VLERSSNEKNNSVWIKQSKFFFFFFSLCISCVCSWAFWGWASVQWQSSEGFSCPSSALLTYCTSSVSIFPFFRAKKKNRKMKKKKCKLTWYPKFQAKAGL